MPWKSLLTVLTETTDPMPVLSHAIALANDYDAHLEAMCIGVDRSHVGYFYEATSPLAVQQTFDEARDEALQIETAVTGILSRSGVRYGTDTAIAQLPDIGRQVAERVRFSDLVILPLPYEEGRGIEVEPVVEAAIFEGQAPVLVVPKGAKPVPRPKTVTLAWNESAEAMSAARAALPILRKAESVQIVVIDPPAHGRHRSDPGGLLATFLARHRVSVKIDVLARSMPMISDILCRHARDNGADMIVMGAYGHSRFREAVLGGATRGMLRQAEVPVFLGH